MSFPSHINENGTIQTVKEHCINVAILAQRRCESVGVGSLAYLAGLLHDTGKCTEEFAEYIRKASNGDHVKRGSVIHTFAGISCLLNRYHSNVQTDMDSIRDTTAEILSLVIGSHHGLFDCFDENKNCGFSHRLEKQPEYDDYAVNAFFTEVADQSVIDELFSKARKEIETIIPKIISCSDDKTSECYLYLSFLTRLLLSALIDGDRTDTADFMNPAQKTEIVEMTQSDWQKCLDRCDSYMSGFTADSPIRYARKELSDSCFHAAALPGGIYRLNLPTGGGKTLSGLRFALKHAELNKKKRIFFLSPLLSILEQNAEQIKNAVGDDSIVLEHHSDVINDDRNEYEASRYDSLCDTWDSPIVITTLVQFLNTLFSGKTSCIRRFHSLVDSIIVIDEVQSVPTKMLSLFNTAMNFLSGICGTTVVLCSATQPEFGTEILPHTMKEAGNIISSETLKKYEQIFKRNTVSYQGRKHLEEIRGLIDKLFDERRSVLVICNKKDQAAVLFESFCDDNIQKYHLSAGMCMAHRKSVLHMIKEELKSGRKILCVSTQVIEAGVDISFESVIRLTAGLDSIVQAAGRCNRNGEGGSDAPVWIVDCVDENLASLKEIHDAKEATRSLLYAYEADKSKYDGELTSEKAVSFYYKKLYRSEPEGYFDYVNQSYPSLYSLLSLNKEFSDVEEAEKYQMHQAMKTAGELFEVFGQNEKSVIVPWEEGEKIITEIIENEDSLTKNLLDRAKPYTVSVYSFMFDHLFQSGAITPIADGRIFVLDKNYYDKNSGITTNMKGDDSWNTLIL